MHRAHLRRTLLGLLIALPFLCGWLCGCALDRSGLRAPGADAEVPPDAPWVDAGRRDARVPDAAPPVDARPPPVDSGPACVPSDEVCDAAGADEDCDGMVNEGCDCTNGASRECAPAVGCSGRQVCAAGAWGTCIAEVTPSTCNGMDDDCDGLVDEDSMCEATTGCQTHRYGGHAYLFCTGPRSFRGAETYCARFGYHLATVNDAAEDMELISELRGRAGLRQRFWIGYEDQNDDGVFRWVFGMSTYENGNTASQGECTLLDANNRDWGGEPCTNTERFICESP